MSISRRGFLGAILAAAAAPAIVRADSIMRVVVPKPVLLTLWGDGVHDDTAALQAMVSGQSVMFNDRVYEPMRNGVVVLPTATFYVASPIIVQGEAHLDGTYAWLRASGDGYPILDARGLGGGSIRNLNFVGKGHPAITAGRFV